MTIQMILCILVLTLFVGAGMAQEPRACATGLGAATVCRVTLAFDLNGEIFDQLEAARTLSFIDHSDPAKPVPIHATVGDFIQAAVDAAIIGALRLHPTATVRQAVADLKAQEQTTEQQVGDSVKIGR